MKTKKRDIGEEILAGLRAIKSGKGRRFRVAAPENAKTVRGKMGLSQQAFAGLLGVSVRTLQDWEQGRRKPTGPAITLLRLADRNPQAFLNL